MMINRIIDYLDELFPNPRCELEYTKDYELLMAIVMSAQTTDKRVNEVNRVLFNRYKSIYDIANADIKDIEKIIKPIGTYKKKSIFIKEIANRLINDNMMPIPNNRGYLESLPGVGRKTVNVFLSVIYNEPTIAVDTHVNRVSKRLGLAKENDDVYEIEMKLRRKFKRENWNKRHKQLVLFGRYYCKAIRPECDTCGIKNICKEKNKRI